MELTLNALQLARPQTRVTTGPFTVVDIDDYLPPELYAELLSTYPDASKDGVHHKMKNYLESGTAAFDSFLAGNPSWSRLLRFMDSDEFLCHLYEFTQPTILASRGKRGARPWCRNGVPLTGMKANKTSIWTKLFGGNKYLEIETGFQLSTMENGHCITPHSDGQDKLVSFLLYFPLSDWRAAWGGGTQFFRPLTPEAERRWCSPKVNHIKSFGEAGLKQFASDMECFHTSPFAANHVTLFCKSNHTFHGVDKISCPADRRRNTLVLNINMKEGSESSWIGRRTRWAGAWSRGQLSPQQQADTYD